MRTKKAQCISSLAWFINSLHLFFTLLISKAAQPQNSVLTALILGEAKIEGIQLLLENPSTGLKETINEIDHTGRTPLDLVDDTESALYQLLRKFGAQHGVDLLLINAVREGSSENVLTLLERGANPRITDESGDSLMHIIAQQSHVSLLPLLFGKIEKPPDKLDASASSEKTTSLTLDINTLNGLGETALEIAIKESGGIPEIVYEFLRYGGELSRQSKMSSDSFRSLIAKKPKEKRHKKKERKLKKKEQPSFDIKPMDMAPLLPYSFPDSDNSLDGDSKQGITSSGQAYKVKGVTKPMKPLSRYTVAVTSRASDKEMRHLDQLAYEVAEIKKHVVEKAFKLEGQGVILKSTADDIMRRTKNLKERLTSGEVSYLKSRRDGMEEDLFNLPSHVEKKVRDIMLSIESIETYVGSLAKASI